MWMAWGQPGFGSDLDALGRVRSALDAGVAQTAAWGPWIALGGLALSLVIWLAGCRTIRPVHVLLQTLSFAAAGAALVPALMSGPWHGMEPLGIGIGGGIVLGLVAGLLTRGLVVPGTAVVTFAALGVLGTVAAMPWIDDASAKSLSASTPATNAGRRESVVVVRRADEDPAAARERAKASAPTPKAAEPSTTSESTFEALRQRVSDVWGGLSATGRTAVASAALGGATFGLLLTLLLCKKAPAIVTAFFGAGAGYLCARSVVAAWEPPWSGTLDQPALVLLGAWVGLGAAGTLVQWILVSPKPPKKEQPA